MTEARASELSSVRLQLLSLNVQKIKILKLFSSSLYIKHAYLLEKQTNKYVEF